MSWVNDSALDFENTAEEIEAAKQDVAATLKVYGEKPAVPIETVTFTEKQVLASWFPDDAPVALSR